MSSPPSEAVVDMVDEQRYDIEISELKKRETLGGTEFKVRSLDIMTCEQGDELQLKGVSSGPLFK